MKSLPRAAVVAAIGLMVLTLALTTDGARVAAQGMKPLLVQIINTAAEPVPVVSPIQRVMMQYPAVASDACPDSAHPVRRILPDGTRVESFAVPPGKMLVVTDVEGIVRRQFNVAWSLGDIAGISVLTMTSAVIRANGQVNAAAVSGDIVPVSVHLQTGGIIGPNLPVCLSERVVKANGFTAADLLEATLQGYLVDE